jgi:glycosyltransferase involved in cell wall biosynthesis
MTSTAGGAGIAATRIHRAEREAGIDSSILCLARPNDPDPHVHQFPTRFPGIVERLALKAGKRLSHTDKASRRRELLGIHGISFSEPVSDYDILKHPVVREADIINLHWVGGFLHWKSFFSGVKKPVVWTLHDLNPVLGGFHFRGDWERSSLAAQRVDDSLVVKKAAVLRTFRRMHIVGPSAWIERESRKSKTLGRFPHSVIPNPIDASSWRPMDRRAARSVFGIPAEGKLILSVSETPGDPRKGGDILQAALSKAQVSSTFSWAAVGTPSPTLDRAFSLGFIADPRLLALAYSAADLFVVPSREDNLPNVILESLSVGTPVVALPVGGMTELIEDGVNGILAKSPDADSLADALLRADSTGFNPSVNREATAVRHDPGRVSDAYRRVYESMLH